MNKWIWDKWDKSDKHELLSWLKAALFALAGCTFGCLLPLSGWCAKQVIVYPRPLSSIDHRQDYKIALLELALKKAGIDFELKANAIPMQQGRAMLELANGLDMDVVWSMTSKQREKELLPIRIPLDKGLLGWRIFLIHQSKKDQFASIQTLEQLKKLQAVQGHDWPDTEILRSNGLAVNPQASYDRMFSLLQYQACDFFPRSVDEIWNETEVRPGMGLEVESTIALQYPTALYFFVKKSNTALAAVLERGLRLALKDGSFDRLFNQYYAESLRRANLKGRKIFRLRNPLLPDEMPMAEKALWFVP